MRLGSIVVAWAFVGCSFSGAAPDPQGEPDANSQVEIDAAVPDAEPEDPDRDGDGILNGDDNCPDTDNPEQENEDADAFGNACDVCPHLDDPNQADDDNDGVGNLCDPQPGQANAWLFFTGFDAPLVGDEWVGEGGYNVTGGELRSQNNQDRYFIRNTTFDHGDEVEIGARLLFANPLGDNGIGFRFGGPAARAGVNDGNNGCWMLRNLNNGFDGYAFVESDEGSVSTNDFVGRALADVAFDVTVTVSGNDYDCAFNPAGEMQVDVSSNTSLNQGNSNVGLVSSFIEMRVPYLYAISLQ